MIQRGGNLVIRMLDDVKQATIKPIIKATVKFGTLIFTYEYAIYDRLIDWGFLHKSINHESGEFARDKDGNGFYKVNVNTIEGVWSLLRSWLRLYRGISQKNYLYTLDFLNLFITQKFVEKIY